MTATQSPSLLIFTLVYLLLIFTLGSTLEFIKNVHFWKLLSATKLTEHLLLCFFHLCSLGNEKRLGQLDYNVLATYAGTYICKIDICCILYPYIV